LFLGGFNVLPKLILRAEAGAREEVPSKITVTVVVLVTTEQGEAVTGLKKTAFKVFSTIGLKTTPMIVSGFGENGDVKGLYVLEVSSIILDEAGSFAFAVEATKTTTAGGVPVISKGQALTSLVKLT
jgi:hypothetical protein